MIAISMGWGVQSFTMAAMSALGELPPVDVALHADTTHESKLTYEFAQRLTPWLEDHGVKVVTVKPRSDPTDNGYCQHDPPFYSLNQQGDSGQGKRQCTTEWKITPMRRWLQANRNRQPIEQWLGISTDEALRMKPSNVKYITHRWPLIEKGMSRNDCIAWLKAHCLEVPPKSACTFCPFHSTKEWRRIKGTPEDWAEAIAVDAAIRHSAPPFDLFVHPARIPLEQVDLRTAEQKGQMRLWDEECTGLCGV